MHTGLAGIVALEQGKPSLELGMVLRDTLGLEVSAKTIDPPPAWMAVIMAQAEMETLAHHQHAPQTPRRPRGEDGDGPRVSARRSSVKRPPRGELRLYATD